MTQLFSGPGAAVISVFFALASCANSDASASDGAGSTSTDVTAVSASAAAAETAVVEQATSAVQQTRFSFSGEMTQGGWIRGVVPKGTVSASLGEETLQLAEDGSFFAAFDRDNAGSAKLTATLGDGKSVSETLTISSRQWNIERVNVARRKGGPSAAYMARRGPELDAIWDARQKKLPENGWQQDFIWPVKGRISGKFGSQRIYRGEPGSYHSGIDIAPGNGVPFVAPADGVVVLAVKNFSLEGNLLIIDHGMGLNSAFLHASKIAVSEGDRVRQGQYIGNIGSSGRATGPHLHWSLKWNNSRLDPLLFVGPM